MFRSIGVAEIFNVAQSVGARLFKNIEVMIFISALYLVINIPLAIVHRAPPQEVRGGLVTTGGPSSSTSTRATATTRC